MLFRLNPSYLQRFQHLLIFSVFWLNLSDSPLPESPVSSAFGIVLFIVLDLLISLIRTAFNKDSVSKLFSILTILIISLFIFLLSRIIVPFAAILPLPRDLVFLKFHVYLIPVLPAVLTAQILRTISIKSRAGHICVIVINLILLSLIMSRRGWSLQLPLDDLRISYALLFLFLFIQTLLVLSGGRSGRRLALIPAILLVLIPLAGILPLSRLYKNESRKEGGGLLESSLFRFDFSDYLSLESSISMKDDLVFLMKMDEDSEKTLTRRFVLSAYSAEKGFYRDSDPAPETPYFLQNEYLLGELPVRWDYPEFEMTDTLRQEYYLVNFDSSAFLGLNSPVSVTPFLSWDSSSFSRIYQVESRVSSAWGWDLLDAGAPEAVTPDELAFLEYYTKGGDREDLKQLASDITSDESFYYGKVEAIKDYLQDHYFYSLNPGESLSGDQLSHFLFVSEKGYCSYFAFSMALLCRSLGIPARVALGFWVDERSQVLNYYPVKANQAHAWVEVFFPRYGWIEFDPTSQTLAPGEDFEISLFSPQEMEPYLKEILENRDSLKIPTASDTAAQPEYSSETMRFFRLRLVRFGGAAFLLILGLYLCIRLLLLYRILNRTKSKKAAVEFFHIHVLIFSSLYGEKSETESIQEYAEHMGEKIPLFPDFVSHYEKIRFGKSSLEDLMHFNELGEKFRAAIFRSVRPGIKISYMAILIRLLFSRWSKI